MAKNLNIDLNTLFEQAQGQFSGLNPNEPGQWPLLPKLASFLLAIVVVVILGWVALLSGQSDELQAERDKEPQLKSEYQAKVAQAVNLAELRKQRIQVEEYVKQLEKQLPGKADMDALLSDINQAGLGRGLDFELFRPGQVVVKDYYAELPIAIRVTGRFHDIGAFTADIANLSRIVTLHNMVVGNVAAKDAQGNLFMDATARTYRYLDQTELDAIRAEKAKQKGPKP
ncbi:type IV pilus assembly protein PilO [Aquabacterium commune]|jgi:type IV pilus assembly protein PilO|uniref:Type IV pilus assembly protein PilO n=1 Tax=Aquabacterium commune TaxID=70586 RepID=A0A4R6RNL1_9BURK|nr:MULTISPECIES: type 4a pilus biogenesis protein PilO [Aquabacterium]MBT9608470.1 type 4a pilus biogenesis protein PilO [Aquabacterium sp.]TDP88303.1 type IV pilus assembly protein PilO [Aquabacterium commune]